MSRQPGKHRPEKGNVTLITALSTLALAGFASLAIDFGYMHYKKSQLQAAVDAAALAGAAAMVSQGQSAALATALTFGRANIAAADQPTAAMTNADVTFPVSGQIEVAAGMTAARGNAVPMSIGRVLGLNTGDVTATARAGSYCVTSAKCIKPFSPPAKFTWNDQCDAGQHHYKNNGMLDPDSACEMASVAVQGYSPADVGVQIVLKNGNPADSSAPGQYGPVDLPPVNKGNPQTGGAAYRTNIDGCAGSNNTAVGTDDFLQLEPGNMTGPTKQGLDALVAQDPGAYWDAGSNSVKGSSYSDPSMSPRVATIAFYDPRDPPTSGRNSIKVYQLGSVFIEGLSGSGDVTCRFIQTLVPAGNIGSSSGTCGLLYAVRLVRDSTR